MNISSLYGKKIVSTAGKQGYVISVNAAEDKLVCLLCADSEENEFTVDVKNIVSIGNGIVYEDRESIIKRAKPIRLGRAGYDENGDFLGTVEEYTFSKDKLIKAKIGKKQYPAGQITVGDAVIVKKSKKLKRDVIKDGKILFGKGTPVTESLLAEAEKQGEYVQTNLKSL